MQLRFGFMENLGKGKLLGCGDSVNTEPGNFGSQSFVKTGLVITSLPDTVTDDDNTLETSLGKSFGSGPNGTEDSIIKDSFFGSSFLVLGCLDFFGVKDWSLGLLVFLVAVGGQEKPRLREGRELWRG